MGPSSLDLWECAGVGVRVWECASVTRACVGDTVIFLWVPTRYLANNSVLLVVSCLVGCYFILLL